MKTFVQTGDCVTVTLPYARTAGQGVLVGALFGVCGIDGASGASVDISIVGVFDVTKDTTQAVTAGQRLYWDDTNKRLTTTATSNYHVGLATQAQNAADATARVIVGYRVPAVGA